MILRKNSKPVELNAKCFGHMDIGADYWDVSLDAIPAEGNTYKEQIKRYLGRIEEAFAEGVGLFIQGLPQTGKTSLAVVVAKYAYSLYTPPTGISFLPMHHFVRTVFDKKIGFYERRGLLILDDVGSEKTTEFSEGVLEGVIRFRCDNRLPTIITTNLKDNQIETRYGENVLKQIQRKTFSVVVGKVNWAEKTAEKINAMFSK